MTEITRNTIWSQLSTLRLVGNLPPLKLFLVILWSEKVSENAAAKVSELFC